MKPAAFLDRDGVIVKYVADPIKLSDIHLFDFSAQAVKILNGLNMHVIVITNQPQIAKGFTTEENVKTMNKKMVDELKAKGAEIDAVYFCPHHPDKGFPGERSEYKIDCVCRKPKTGMLEWAKERFDIDMHNSFIIGDSTVDIKTGENAKENYPGFRTILVKTGLAGKDGKYGVSPDFTSENLLEAAKLIKPLLG